MKPNRRRGGRGAKNAGKTFKRVMAYISGGYRIRFIAVLVCIVINSCVGAAASLFLQTLIDDYIKPLMLETNPVFSGLLKVIFIMCGLYIAGIVSTLLYQRTMVTISQGVLKDIRDNMFNHMQTLPIKYFDTHNFGDVMSYYTNDTDALREMISQSIPQLFSCIVTIIVVLAAMLSISVWLTLIVFAFVLLKLFLAGKIGGASAKYFIKQQQSLGAVDSYIEEMVNGQKVIKVFCHEEKAKTEFDRRNDELMNNAANANKFANMMMPIMANLGQLLYVVVAIVGGAMAISGKFGLTLGAIVSFVQLCRSFNMPINNASQQVNAIAMALAGAERIFELLDEEPEADEGTVTLVNAVIDENGKVTEADKKTGQWAWKQTTGLGSVQYTPLRGDVRFYNVDFSYDGEKTVLSDVSLFAKPGQKIAFVGATGAGKTTITNLINRFYDIADGKIRYDDININKIKKSDLRRSLGIVLQDVSLFTGTVMENIRYGRLDATDEDVILAAKRANAHDFITMLPNGYDTVLEGDGSGLSQGQRQLLSIARAVVADPPVMILDEATSSIDTRTEAIVQRGMDALMEGRTVFVIAHRLSTVRNSKAIMVLDHGRIIERGSHEELIEQKGQYYQLYTGAFELE